MGLSAADLTGLAVAARPDGASFRVRVQPRGRRDELLGVLNGALKLRVQAPPLEGRANDAVIALLAEQLSVGRHSLRIVSGAQGRDKVLIVAGLTPAELLDRLAAVAG